MPIIKQAGAQTGAQLANPLQLSFVERLKAGRVVPILSDAAIVDLTIGGQQRLVTRLAEFMAYPMPDKERVVQVVRFYKIHNGLKEQDVKSHYLNFVKNHIYLLAQTEGASADLLAEAEAQVDDLTASDFAHILGYPRFLAGASDPLLLLANLPIKVILTTSPHTFIEDALRKAGKQPLTELCRWRRELDSIDPAITAGYRPTAQQPLVYHLHGLDKYPDSLVLSEDDHLEFLVNICQGAGNNAMDRVHGLVRQALFDDLILLGFSLSDWGFRALYAGLIKPNGRQEDRGVCCLQLAPDAVERQYLQEYLEREAKFEVFWGTLDQYALELRRLLNL